MRRIYQLKMGHKATPRSPTRNLGNVQNGKCFFSARASPYQPVSSHGEFSGPAGSSRWPMQCCREFELNFDSLTLPWTNNLPQPSLLLLPLLLQPAGRRDLESSKSWAQEVKQLLSCKSPTPFIFWRSTSFCNIPLISKYIFFAADSIQSKENLIGAHAIKKVIQF